MAAGPSQRARDLANKATLQYIAQHGQAPPGGAPSAALAFAKHIDQYAPSKKTAKLAAKDRSSRGSRGGGGGLLNDLADAGGEAVDWSLDKLGIPLAAASSPLRMAALGYGNVLREIAGKKPVNIEGEIGPAAFVRDVGNRITPLDIFAQQKIDKKTGKAYSTGKTQLADALGPTIGPLADTGLNIAASVGVDPLTAIAPAVHAAEVPELINKLEIASRAAHTAEEGSQLAEIAAKVNRAKGLGALSSEEVARVAEVAPEVGKGGLQAFGKPFVPQDAYRGLTAPTRFLRNIAGDALDKSEALSKLRGLSGPFRQAERSGEAVASEAGFEGRRAFTTEPARAAHEMSDLHQAATALVKDWAPEDKALLGRAIQGDAEAAAKLGDKVHAVPELRNILDTVHGKLTNAGVKLGYTDKYLPHAVEDEVLKRAKNGTRSTVGRVIHDLSKARKIGPGTETIWGKIPENLNPAQVTSWMNEHAMQTFGHDYYRTDVNDVLDIYFRGAAKKLGEARANQLLTSKGLAAPQEVVNTARANEAAVSRATARGDAAAEAEARAYGERLVRDTTGHATEAVVRGREPMGSVVTAEGRQALGKHIRLATFEQVSGHPEFAYSPELAGILDKVNALTAPKSFGEFISTYDKVLTYLKSYQILTPGFHFRNAYGGLFNNALAGISPSTYPKWFKANKIFSAEGEAALRAKMGDQIADAYMGGRAIAGYGQIGFESTAAKGGTKLGRAIPGGPNFKLLDLSHHAGTNVEGFLRGSLAMDAVLKGQSLASAHDLVTMFHFDYSDLTGFEKNAVKRVIPFYTWMRHNVPLQAEMLLRRPSIYSRLNVGLRTLGAGTDLSGVAVPDYYDQSGARPTPFTEQGQPVLFQLANTLPIGDLYGATDPGTVPSMVSPLIKTPLELWAGKQVFKGLPLTNQRVDAPQPLQEFAPLLKAAGLADKDGKVTAKAAYAMEQFMPLLARVRRAAPSETKYQERAVTTWLNLLAGLGLRTVTKSEQKNARKYGASRRLGGGK